jgi:phage tail tape-measure protein
MGMMPETSSPDMVGTLEQRLQSCDSLIQKSVEGARKNPGSFFLLQSTRFSQSGHDASIGGVSGTGVAHPPHLLHAQRAVEQLRTALNLEYTMAKPNKSDKSETSALGAAGGAAAGAAAGSVLGPLGAAVGAVIGGIAGSGAKVDSIKKQIPDTFKTVKKAVSKVTAKKTTKAKPTSSAKSSASKKGAKPTKKASAKK